MPYAEFSAFVHSKQLAIALAVAPKRRSNSLPDGGPESAVSKVASKCKGRALRSTKSRIWAGAEMSVGSSPTWLWGRMLFPTLALLSRPPVISSRPLTARASPTKVQSETRPFGAVSLFRAAIFFPTLRFVPEGCDYICWPQEFVQSHHRNCLVIVASLDVPVWHGNSGELSDPPTASPQCYCSWILL